MDGFITALIVVGLIIVLLLLIYLIDRVNTIERETRHIKVAPAPTSSAPPNLGPFAGLSGRKLWDAMTGPPPNGLDANEWAMVRDRYAMVLQLHIESLFEEGQRDAKRGLNSEPKNPRVIVNPNGNVESWIPPAQMNSLYQCGLGSVNVPEEALIGIRDLLNQTGRSLYQQTGISPIPVQSDLLLPGALPALPSLVDPEIVSGEGVDVATRNSAQLP